MPNLGARVEVSLPQLEEFWAARITASKRGVSASVGSGPFQVTKSATGRTTSTVRIIKLGSPV
ncbi:DUF4236 domain-containing protein [Arthrobacter sp. NPDC093125]|uniref:DUF4236 domain-containing protein n=1 Tax=Arthrobacter sp. NPDC093125 TaxID=3363944 RepID=UPI00381F2826